MNIKATLMRPSRDFTGCRRSFSALLHLPFSVAALVSAGFVAFSLFGVVTAAGEEAGTEEKISSFRPIIARQERSVDKALQWLAKQQGRDGSWSSGLRGSGGYRTAMTGLAGLAFLSAGYLPGRGKYGSTLIKAVNWTLKQQRRDGFIADPGSTGRGMYGHGFSMLFLAQAYGMMPGGEKDAKIRSALEKAIKLTMRAQSGMGGWYYSPNSGSDEGSVTITQIQALRACQNVGVDVPKKTLDRAIGYIRKSQQTDGGIAYRAGMRGSRPAISAAGAELMMMAGLYKDRATKRLVAYLKRTITPTSRGGFDSYTQFYAAQAYHHLGGRNWEKYFDGLRKRLIREQTHAGNWNPSGWGAGPVFDTSVRVIILTLPYEYLPIYQR